MIGPAMWPAEIVGIGRKETGQPFGRCRKCPPEEHPANACSFVRYGGIPYCKKHAIEAAHEKSNTKETR